MKYEHKESFVLENQQRFFAEGSQTTVNTNKEWLGAIDIVTLNLHEPSQLIEANLLIQTNFIFDPAYDDMDTQVKEDYLRANRFTDLSETMQTPGTIAYGAKSKLGLVGLIIARDVGADVVGERYKNFPDAVDFNQPAIDVRRLHVRHDCLHLGIGSHLLDYVVAIAKARGIKLLIGETTDPAQWFVKKVGCGGMMMVVDRKNGTRASVFRCFLQVP